MDDSTGPFPEKEATNLPTTGTYQLLSVFSVLLLLLVAVLFHLVTIVIATLAMGETVKSAKVPYSFIRKSLREGATAIRLLVSRRGVYRSTHTTGDGSNNHGFGDADGHAEVLEEITV